MLRGTPGFECFKTAEEGPDAKFLVQLDACMDVLPGIIACAQHGIVRGKSYGIVGNFNSVKRARDLLIEARVSDLWPSDDEIKEFVKWKLPEGQMYQCKGCDRPI
ncbi:hypothetical protein FRC12_003077 [Ceratobasidium sp. 428]|nr:hypothetical protein FRC12_003077 [Ceratobasidium sp. 428]